MATDDRILDVDVYWSMRSPYSYLALQRLVYLNSNYNVDIDVRVIFPVAARTRVDSGEAGSGRWYKWEDAVHDTRRVGKFQGAFDGGDVCFHIFYDGHSDIEHGDALVLQDPTDGGCRNHFPSALVVVFHDGHAAAAE